MAAFASVLQSALPRRCCKLEPRRFFLFQKMGHLTHCGSAAASATLKEGRREAAVLTKEKGNG